MDSGMTVAAFVISCLSVLAAGLAVWYARAQKRVAERAAAASERSADAAESSAREATRSADAATELASIERDRRADEIEHAEQERKTAAGRPLIRRPD